MKIYTSYWAMVRNFPRNLVGLNTTVWPPRWRPLGQDKGGIWVIDCPPLKPGEECAGLCNGKCEVKTAPDCAFLQTYRAQLEKIDFPRFCASLENLVMAFAEGENLNDVQFALIIYETPDKQCSERWAIQEWLRAHGVEVEEWKK